MAFTGVLGRSNSNFGNFALGRVGATGPAPTDVGAGSTLTLTQTATVSLTVNRALTSTLTLTQRANLQWNLLTTSTLTLSQSVDDLLIDNTEITSALDLDQTAEASVSFGRLVQQSLFLTQQASAQKIITQEVEHTLNLSHQALRVHIGEASSTLTLTQDADGGKSKSVSASNTLALSHTVERNVDFVRTVNQGLPMTQSATKSASFTKVASNTLALSQTAVGIATRLASNTLTLTQTATADYSKGAKNTITLTQSATKALTLNRTLISALIPFQSATVSGTFRRTVTSNLALSQSVTVNAVRFATNHLNLTQTATVAVARSTFSQLDLHQAVTLSVVGNKAAASTLIMFQDLFLQKSKAVQANHVLAFNQQARGNLVHNVSASNNLALTQALVADYQDEDVLQVLALDHDATVQKVSPRVTSNVLALTQTASVSKTIVRSVAHQLTFLASTDKRTGVSAFPIVTIPTAQVTVVKKKCVMILEGQGSITLPCPEFNDKEGSLIRLNIKRAMDGTRRAYRRDNPTSKLNYDLVMDRLKAIELRQFLLVNNSIPLKLTNFKGELWFVLLTNTPFSFVEDAFRDSPYGNRATISLEFEGVRLN